MAEHPAASGLASVASPALAYAVVIEAAPHNYSAYVPDLPGCIATGDTIEEVTRLISEAMAIHVAGMREDGEIVPAPQTQVAIIPAGMVPADDDEPADAE